MAVAVVVVLFLVVVLIVIFLFVIFLLYLVVLVVDDDEEEHFRVSEDLCELCECGCRSISFIQIRLIDQKLRQQQTWIIDNTHTNSHR